METTLRHGVAHPQADIDARRKQERLKLVQATKAEPTPDKMLKTTTAIRQTGEVVLASTAIWAIGHVPPASTIGAK
jgi:hypothetical protein